jgi:hypothetical protein
MVAMKLSVLTGFGLFCLTFLGACAHFARSEKVTTFARLSGIDSLSEQSKQAIDVDSQKKYGIYRAVVSITGAEAEAIKSGNSSLKWLTGPVPTSIWKSTIMMGSDRTIPERFIPVYTNNLLYYYSEKGVYSQMYVLDVTEPSRPLLYFVSTDVR